MVGKIVHMAGDHYNRDMEKICVILGAGASFDCSNKNAPIRNLSLQPPLAKELFNIGRSEEYWTTVSQYPDAIVIANEVAARARSDEEFNLELALSQYAYHKDPRIREHFKSVPPYIRDLLTRSSYEYLDMPGSYLQLVVNLLAESEHEVLFLVFNYDVLLETAISQFENTVEFEHIDHYVIPGRSVNLVKLHGSVNWFVELAKDSQTPWEMHLPQFNIFRTDREVVVENSPNKIADRVRDIRINGFQVYPYLTAPMVGKELLSASCPALHVQYAQAFLSDCRKFLVIGTSGQDEDLIQLLGQSIKPSPVKYLQVVGKGTDAQTTLE